MKKTAQLTLLVDLRLLGVRIWCLDDHEQATLFGGLAEVLADEDMAYARRRMTYVAKLLTASQKATLKDALEMLWQEEVDE